MHDYYEQASVALRIYVERSRAIIQCLREGRASEGESLLALKDAAFHNFRVADYMLRKQGIDLADDEKIQAIVAEIQETDAQLRQAMVKWKEQVAAELEKARGLRAHIKKYRSGWNDTKTMVEAAV